MDNGIHGMKRLNLQLTLLAKFSVTSLLLIAGLGMLLGWFITQQFQEQAVEQREFAMSSLVPPVIGPYLSADVLANGASGSAYQAIDQSLSYLGGSGLVGVKVWNKDGTIIYSDNATLIGKKSADPVASSAIADALDGTTSAQLIPAGSAQSPVDTGYGQLLVVYVPLQLPGVNTIGAAFEGYYDAQDLSDRIDYIDRFLWTGITFGALLLYTSLFTLVYNASRKLSRQNEENARLYRHAQQRLVERQEAQKQTALQVERLGALRAIDIAITSSLEPRLTLSVVLDQVCSQLHVDAADILLLDAESATLKYAVGRGFRSAAITKSCLRLGEGYAGRAALLQHAGGCPDLSLAADARHRALLSTENFRSYYVLPLIARGAVKGVLEVFQRTPLEPDDEWKGFLEALAGQAAIAIDNTTMFEDLQRSNMELAFAYDMTLEGWSRALDLRDKETEGHTQRVTELAVKLAEHMGIDESQLLHVRRGALLHDIGKMGIPDAILLKPGPLTEHEWRIMRLHPTYAYELLSPIPFLGPALEIPYYHHEKWDGSGYPEGLAGEKIPLAARIFAIADVWDALRSDRPYRAALPEKEVLAFLAEQSGSHFDPAVVQAFFSMQAPGELSPQEEPELVLAATA